MHIRAKTYIHACHVTVSHILHSGKLLRYINCREFWGFMAIYQSLFCKIWRRDTFWQHQWATHKKFLCEIYFPTIFSLASFPLYGRNWRLHLHNYYGLPSRGSYVHHRCIRSSCASRNFNWSSVIHFGHAIVCNDVTFGFYIGVSHMYMLGTHLWHTVLQSKRANF